MDKQQIHLYRAEELDAVARPKSVFAQKAYDYVWGVGRGSNDYITNIETEYRLLVVGDIYLPVSVNNIQWNNAYVCSPYTHYVTYAYDELQFVPNRVAQKVLYGVIRGCDSVLRRTNINAVVAVNNWLLSTNLYPELSAATCHAITQFLSKAFPGHAIMFRSLQEKQHGDMLAAMRRDGYIRVPSRQVYIWDPDDQSKLKKSQRKDLRRDESLLSNKEYTLERLKPDDAAKIDLACELYSKLYIEKYSSCNPKLTSAFFAHVIEHGICEVYMLTHLPTGNKGVAGFICSDTTVTAPIFGYQVDVENGHMLYRMASAMTYKKARESNLICHKSSGAPDFKRNRGCLPYVEYSGVYVQHLPFHKRLVWYVLSGLLFMFAVPVLKKNKL